MVHNYILHDLIAHSPLRKGSGLLLAVDANYEARDGNNVAIKAVHNPPIRWNYRL